MLDEVELRRISRGEVQVLGFGLAANEVKIMPGIYPTEYAAQRNARTWAGPHRSGRVRTASRLPAKLVRGPTVRDADGSATEDDAAALVRLQLTV